ncbi:hypothetical protein M0802_014811 [Mischocyttarus mexicanus]|nr:hypothetical protein M0802_014811 [Mischocyttarus mexicanus]
MSFQRSDLQSRKEVERERRPEPTKAKKAHCFSCGSPDHSVRQCSALGKGPKIVASEDLESVVIQGKKFMALVDSGSDLTLLREDKFTEIGSVEFTKTIIRAEGAGNGKIRIIGAFVGEINVDDVVCNIKIHVVPTGAIPNECILGKNVLSNVEVIVRKGKVVKMVQIHENEEKGKTKRSAEQEDDTRSVDGENAEAVCEEDVMKGVFNITMRELDVKPQFVKEVEQLVVDYKPAKQVKTSVETQIKLHDDVPVTSRPRRLAPREKEVLNKQITEWLDEGVVRESKSEWASLVVIVPKKDGTSRICVDYRALNHKISHDHFSMPLIEDCIDDLVNMRVFFVIDLKNGFFHVPVEESRRKYTSLVTPDGQFKFNETLFGLCNSLTSFLRFIAEVFREFINCKVVFTYVDDKVVPGINDEDWLSKLKVALEVAARNGFQINWHKW